MEINAPQFYVGMKAVSVKGSRGCYTRVDIDDCPAGLVFSRL